MAKTAVHRGEVAEVYEFQLRDGVIDWDIAEAVSRRIEHLQLFDDAARRRGARRLVCPNLSRSPDAELFARGRVHTLEQRGGLGSGSSERQSNSGRREAVNGCAEYSSGVAVFE